MATPGDHRGRAGPACPILRSFDEAAARAFYVDWLGFEVVFEHRFEPDAPLYMGLRLGDCVVHLSEHFGDATPGSGVRIPMPDLPGFHASLKPYRNYRPDLVEQSWGCLEMLVRDPSGNRLVFYEAI